MFESARVLRTIRNRISSIHLRRGFLFHPLFAITCCLGALLTLCHAQDADAPSGAIIGFVLGPDQTKLAGVEASLAREGAPATTSPSVTTTDGSGRFTFAKLLPGTYGLSLSRAGWVPKRFTHLRIRRGKSVGLGVTLSPAETVAAPPGAASDRREPLQRNEWWGMRLGIVPLQGLPTSRTLSSILDGQETSIVVDKFEYGGLETGRAALFGAHGASWTENSYFLNGLDVTDPYATGEPMMNPDYDAITEMTAVTAVKPPSLPNSGVDVDVTIPEPVSGFHGSARALYSNHALQSNNMNARLARLNFPGPERVNNVVDTSARLGGQMPISGAAWPYFVSFSRQQLSKQLGGFAAPIDAHTNRFLTEMTPYASGSRRLDLLYAAQQNFDSRDGADLFLSPAATKIRNDNFQQFQVRWNDSLNANSVLQLAFGVAHANLSSGLQNGPLSISTLDLPLLNQMGAAPLATRGTRTRFDLMGSLATAYNGMFGGHAFIFGGGFDRSSIRNNWNAFGGTEEILVDSMPSEVIQWSTPAAARDELRNLSAYIQDRWRLSKWVSLWAGLRLENSAGRALGANNRIDWTDLQPHVGIVFPVPGKMTFRGGWNRYGHLLQGRYLDYGNPSALGEQIFRWQNGGLGQLLQVFGGPYSAIDPHLHRPFTDEISVGLERQFGEHFGVRARGFRRDDHSLVEPVDIGVPFSDYIPMPVNEPGLDGIFGTNDDQQIVVYNEKSAALGKNVMVLSNPPGYEAMYEGVEVEFMERYSTHWEAGLGFAAMLTSARTNTGYTPYQNDTGVIGPFFGGPPIPMLAADPNAQLFAPGLTYFDRGKFGKLHVYYNTRRHIQIGLLARYYDGLPFARLLFVKGFNQGPSFVRAMEYNDCCGDRTLYNLTIDLRIRRDFAIWRGTLSGIFDCFNILNSSNNTFENVLTSPTFQERVPLSVQAPRLAKLGVEWSF